jgi:hypothetical protein
MKNRLASFLALALLSTASANAATLAGGDLATGITLSNGTTALSSGTIRFGYFATGFDFANNNNFAALDAAFIEVTSYSGAIEELSTPGFKTINLAYNENGTFEGTAFDNDGAPTTDIGGEKVYTWVLNDTTAANATQHAIFSSNNLWTDADTVPSADSSVSWEAGTSGLVAHIGSLSTGTDIGGGQNSHSLAAIGAVPEPSRAMLGFVGIAAMLFRRRRA